MENSPGVVGLEVVVAEGNILDLGVEVEEGLGKTPRITVEGLATAAMEEGLVHIQAILNPLEIKKMEEKLRKSLFQRL